MIVAELLEKLQIMEVNYCKVINEVFKVLINSFSNDTAITIVTEGRASEIHLENLMKSLRKLIAAAGAIEASHSDDPDKVVEDTRKLVRSYCESMNEYKEKMFNEAKKLIEQ